MPTYKSLRIENEIADQYRHFAKEIVNENQSKTLALVMNYFHRNQVTPFDDVKGSFGALEKRMFKRVDALVAILRNQEKNYIKPIYNHSKLTFELLPKLQNTPSELGPEHPNKISDEYQEKVTKIAQKTVQFLEDLKSNTEPDLTEIIALKRELKTLCM